MENTPRAYRAIFFDLDGTLLPMDLDEFLGTYFKALVGFVARRGLDASAFHDALMAGTKAMMEHDDAATNAETFWGVFFGLVDEGAADWQALLDEFYATEFGAIGANVQPNEAMVRAVATLKEKGYPLVLATMPMFPMRAVEWRLRWAGLDPVDFARVTHYENSTATKPKLTYYAENLAACGVSGRDVLMVGNNTVEDLAIRGLGADAYLVCDYLLDPVPGGFDLDQVRHSSCEEFAAWAASLPTCAKPACGIDASRVDAAARDAVLRREAHAEAVAAQRAAQEASDALNEGAMRSAGFGVASGGCQGGDGATASGAGESGDSEAAIGSAAAAALAAEPPAPAPVAGGVR